MRECVLDANVLLRLLTNEPPDLAEQVSALLDEADRSRVDLVVTSLTLAEAVYVLESFYRWPRREVADRLLDLISSSALTIVERDLLAQALAWYRDVQAVHFADAYIAAVADARGHGQVISLDRALRKVPGITVIQDPSQIGSS